MSRNIIAIYALRGSNIAYQARFETLIYGKNTFKYYDTNLWKLLPNEIKDSADILFNKSFIMTWEDPKFQCNMCNIFF